MLWLLTTLDYWIISVGLLDLNRDQVHKESVYINYSLIVLYSILEFKFTSSAIHF